MEDQIGSQTITVLKMKPEVDSTNQTLKTSFENSKNADPVEVETNPEPYTNLENGSEVITIVAQENDGQVYIFHKQEEVVESESHAENPDEFIQVCDSNNALEVEESQVREDVNVDVVGEGSTEEKDEAETVETNDNDKEKENEKLEDGQLKNYKNVILEDWEVEVPQVIENHTSGQTQIAEVIEAQEVIAYNNENCTVVEVTASEGDQILVENANEEIISVTENQKENSVEDSIMLERKIESLKIPKSITKTEIVKILDESADRVVRPIVAGKDLFFSIELTKRLNQKLSLKKSLKAGESVSEKNTDSDTCNNNNTVDDRQKIVEILEADEVKDWKSTPSQSDQKSKENSNDMEITKAIKNMEGANVNKDTPRKPVRRAPFKKFRIMDKELERTIALQQLREEFPTTRKRSRTTKKVNHIPFIASTILEKALTSPEVTTALKPGPPKRRPCYLPDNLSSEKSNQANAPPEGVKSKKTKGKPQEAPEEETNNSKKDYLDLEPGKPNAVVKTYSAKRKSTDAENEIKSTIAAVTKALSESAEEANESKPKKQKTVMKQGSKQEKNKVLIKKKRKLKAGMGSDKKMHSELEKLLGDEGAVRMLYDTQHSETSSVPPKKPKFRTTTGIKKDLVLKTKLVKNAVMRLSGVGTEGVSLRGKRRSLKPQPKPEVRKSEEPLFSSTPIVVLYKPKKKHRAEASRILYRHSSSESFDSSEGYRRTSIDTEGLNTSSVAVNGDKSEGVASTIPEADKPKLKKSELVIRRKVKRIESPKREGKVSKSKSTAERLSTETVSTAPSKLNLSNVPVRKSSRPRTVSKKYSIWSSTSMDSLSVESLGLKKLKKASTELGKKLNVKELNVLQYGHLFQVVLTPTSTFLKNSLNHEVLQEVIQVLSYLSEDDNCKVVLLSSQGSTFCQGVDIIQIISFRENERKTEVSQLVRTVREFVKCLSEFKKPVIAGVHGAAVGLGVTLLPYCDLVISSDKAAFYTPYVKLGQAPEGAPTHTFPRINRLLVSELLFKSHKMTATDALKHGLVTQIIPEERFEEELIVIAKNMASQPVQGIQSIKFLLRSLDHDEIDEILRAEGEILEEQWNSSECLNNIVKFLNFGELQMKHMENT